MIEEEYISFETAKLAKEKGFNEEISTLYKNGIFKHHKQHHSNNPFISNMGMTDNCCSAPTQSLLARWLREVHNMCVEVYSTGYGFIWCICDTDSGTDRRFSNETGSNDSGAWDTYEDAMEAGLQEALRLIK